MIKLFLPLLFPLPLIAQPGAPSPTRAGNPATQQTIHPAAPKTGAPSHTDTPITTDINTACYKTITVTSRPDFIAASGNDAWVIDDTNGLIKKISVKEARPLLAVKVPLACAAPVIAFNSVWVISCAEKQLYRLDRNTGRVLAKITTGIADPNGEMSLAAGAGSVWLLSDSSGVLTRIDPQTNTVQTTVKVKPHSYCAGYGYHAVWVTNTGDNSVQRVDAGTNTVVATIPAGKNPRFISVGEQGVWTLNQGDGTVTRIDAATNTNTATIDVKAPGPGGDIAEGDGRVWIVSTNNSRPVQTINTASNKTEAIYTQVGGEGSNIQAHGDGSNIQPRGDGSNTRDQTYARVDGAVRISGRYVWVSGLYLQKVWVFRTLPVSEANR